MSRYKITYGTRILEVWTGKGSVEAEKIAKEHWQLRPPAQVSVQLIGGLKLTAGKSVAK